MPFAPAGDSEDCLTLEVYTPTNATPDSKLPVWFFIPGGGYAVNLNVGTNGTEVIAHSGHGIVFVYVNYRVGVYGFLASEEIRQNGDLNVGLLDQRKALEWVQMHISQVGRFKRRSRAKTYFHIVRRRSGSRYHPWCLSRCWVCSVSYGSIRRER